MKLSACLKLKALGALSVVVIAITFQNCGKAPLNQIDTLSDATTKLAASQFSKLSVMDEQKGETVSVDLNSGKIEKVSLANPAAGIQQKCLSEADRDRLDAILIDAEICKPAVARSEGVCTQIYTEPYAILSELDQSVRLGERMDGCAQATDLCDEKSAELRAFVSEFKARVDQMNCQ